MENSLITSKDINLPKKLCEKLKKRTIRSFTPDIKVQGNQSTVIDPPKIVPKLNFHYDSKSRRITAPLIGEIFLGRDEFHLISPKSPKNTIEKKEKFKEINLNMPNLVSSFISETKTMFRKKKNYVYCLRKSIRELNSICIPDDQLINLDKIVSKNPYDHEKSRTFIRACKYGIINLVRKLIRESPYIVHSFDDMLMTGLHWCAIRSNIKVAGILLENHAFIDAIDASHRTPLFLAVKSGNFEVIRFLLINKADPSITSNFKKKLTEYAKTHTILDLLKKATIYHNLAKHLPKDKRDEKWRTEIIPAFLRISNQSTDDKYI